MDAMRVARVGLAAVKGCRHQPQDQVWLDEHGPRGDRLWCLVDPGTRRVLKTVENASLLGVVATWRSGVLRVTVDGEVCSGRPEPSGRSLRVSYWGRPITVELIEGGWTEPLSCLLRRPVLLARTRPGDVVYGGSVSLISTEAVAALMPHHRDGSAEPGPGAGPALDPERDGPRFRATFTVDSPHGLWPGPGEEQTWVGRELAVGEARVLITGSIARCGVVDLQPSTGRRDLRLLAALPRDPSGEPVFGLQGRVVRPGWVVSGCQARLTAG